jgi:hypothetical protein
MQPPIGMPMSHASDDWSIRPERPEMAYTHSWFARYLQIITNGIRYLEIFMIT